MNNGNGLNGHKNGKNGNGTNGQKNGLNGNDHAAKIIAKPFIALPDDLDERVDMASAMLALGYGKKRITKELGKKYACLPGDAREYVRLAQEQFVEELDEPMANHRANILEFLRSILRNPLAPVDEKLKATKQIATLLGLNAVKGHENKPSRIKLELPDWQADLRKARDEGRLKTAPKFDGFEG